MGYKTGITWTDHTLNWWWGCTEVTEACDYCYAKAWAKRIKAMEWGDKAERIKINSAPKELKKFDTHARDEGVMKKVFVQSMSDVFDVAVKDSWRIDLLSQMSLATNLWFQVLTKRPAKVKPYEIYYPIERVWLGTSLGSNKDLPLAKKIVENEALLHWISYEPAIEALDVNLLPDKIKWLVIGGESGSPRPFHIEWAIDAIQKCRQRGIKVFMKQLGKNPFYKGKAHHISDSHGKILDEWPDELRIQEFPI